MCIPLFSLIIKRPVSMVPRHMLSFLYFRHNAEGLGSVHCSMKWRVCSYIACLGCGVDLLATRDQLMAVCVFSVLSNIELCTGLLPGGIICLLIFASQPCYPINSETHNSVIVSSYMKSNKWTINKIVCKLLVSPPR